MPSSDWLALERPKKLLPSNWIARERLKTLLPSNWLAREELAKLLLSDETVLRSFAPVLKKRTDHQDAKDTRVAIDQSPQGFSLGAPGVLVVLSPLAKLH